MFDMLSSGQISGEAFPYCHCISNTVFNGIVITIFSLCSIFALFRTHLVKVGGQVHGVCLLSLLSPVSYPV